MWVFWVIAVIPIAIGAVLYWRDNEVVWWEWLLGSAVALLTAGLMQLAAFKGMTDDVETWSGMVVKVAHYPAWTEEYEEEHSETYKDSDGKEHTRTWTTTEHDHHPEHWEETRDFGTYTAEPQISESEYLELRRAFGGRAFTEGKQSTSHFGGSFDGGDNNIYATRNDTGAMIPVTTLRHFENRIKAAPSVFSFAKVPANISTYPWPRNEDARHSGRLLGTAPVLIDQRKWDCMNSLLGPHKRVNVILIGFGNRPAEHAHWQEAAWVGGKKNDLVICFGGGTREKPADWAYVFGWTEHELAKKNLQTLLLNNPVNDNLIGQISAEITRNYVIKDWHKFDYISIQPPTWSYWVYFLVLGITQSALYFVFHSNGIRKEGVFTYARRRYSW